MIKIWKTLRVLEENKVEIFKNSVLERLELLFHLFDS